MRGTSFTGSRAKQSSNRKVGTLPIKNFFYRFIKKSWCVRLRVRGWVRGGGAFFTGSRVASYHLIELIFMSEQIL